MTFAEQITAHAATMHGETSEEKTTNAEIANEEQTSQEAPSATENNAVIAETQSSEQQTSTPEEQVSSQEAPKALDYNAILGEISGGEINDLETFKSSLPKLKEYDTILKDKQELEEKFKGTIVPANDYLKKLNELHQNGATADQIKSFQRLNDLGDLTNLDPFETKVHKMVQDGWSEEMARKAVAQEYPLSELDEDSDEYQILNEKLRLSAEKDKMELQKSLVELSTIGEEKIKAEEQQKLETIAQQEKYKNDVKAIIPKIAPNLKGLGEINLNGEEGEKAIKLNFNYNEEFKKDVPQLLDLFFNTNQLPLTEENIKKAEQYVQDVYWGVNKQSIIETAVKHTADTIRDQVENKYINRSGLPNEQQRTHTTGDVQSEKAAFLERIANRGN